MTGTPSFPLAAALEAILFTSNRPLKVRELQQATDASRAAVEDALRELEAGLERRGVMLQRLDEQVHLVTRPELSAYVRRALRPEASGRLSAAALETLAIVAYHQPVTRSRIERVRGVNSDSVLANLELRDLVQEVGREASPGQPRLFGTTMRFLQVMGLRSLGDLPPPPGEARADGVGREPPREDPEA
ncbi:MAG: SMC-Scp complex subunit ScpB [Candidatus Dormibacteraeota bacterium]|nr:SMC-Scp complex subunit ScpB [Candidatus Dormibacteraeota bacterium]